MKSKSAKAIDAFIVVGVVVLALGVVVGAFRTREFRAMFNSLLLGFIIGSWIESRRRAS